jgi:hypothetical protein
MAGGGLFALTIVHVYLPSCPACLQRYLGVKGAGVLAKTAGNLTISELESLLEPLSQEGFLWNLIITTHDLQEYHPEVVLPSCFCALFCLFWFFQFQVTHFR